MTREKLEELYQLANDISQIKKTRDRLLEVIKSSTKLKCDLQFPAFAFDLPEKDYKHFCEFLLIQVETELHHLEEKFKNE